MWERNQIKTKKYDKNVPLKRQYNAQRVIYILSFIWILFPRWVYPANELSCVYMVDSNSKSNDKFFLVYLFRMSVSFTFIQWKNLLYLFNMGRNCVANSLARCCHEEKKSKFWISFHFNGSRDILHKERYFLYRVYLLI